MAKFLMYSADCSHIKDLALYKVVTFSILMFSSAFHCHPAVVSRKQPMI